MHDFAIFLLTLNYTQIQLKALDYPFCSVLTYSGVKMQMQSKTSVIFKIKFSVCDHIEKNLKSPYFLNSFIPGKRSKKCPKNLAKLAKKNSMLFQRVITRS